MLILIAFLAVDFRAYRRLLREKLGAGDPTGAVRRGGSRPARGKRRYARESTAVLNKSL